MLKQLEDDLVPLKGLQIHKHEYIKTFFRLNRKRLEAVYRKLNVSLRLNAENWHRYVNSKELFDMVYPLMCTVTYFTRDAVAHSEPADSLGIEMHTEKHEMYIAMSFELHDNLMIMNVDLGIKQHATRAFITMLNHFMFKHLYKKPFTILQGAGGDIFRLNENLDYVYAYHKLKSEGGK
ncbi:MAG: hypothetical protein WC638_02745 [Candidatus Paceibacterota bacterium]|jgi:hypothetical protein